MNKLRRRRLRELKDTEISNFYQFVANSIIYEMPVIRDRTSVSRGSAMKTIRILFFLFVD